MRDRDVMNLLDQLELFTLGAGKGRVSQKDYWLFVYKSMRSGELMTRTLEAHLHYKLRSLGVEPSPVRTSRGGLRITRGTKA